METQQQERELNRVTVEHWNGIQQAVLKKWNSKQAAILDNKGKVTEWVAYKQESDLVDAV